MVKVFLCETAKDCIFRLQVLMQEKNDACVLFPNSDFYTKFTAFYPQIETARLFTPDQLLRDLNVDRLDKEVAYLLNSYDGLMDPNLILLNTDLGEDLKAFQNVGFLSQKFSREREDFSFKNCIFYGPFPKNIQTILVEKLKKIFLSVFIIERSFNERTFDLPQKIKSYHVENITEEKLWIEKRWTQNKNFLFVTSYYDKFTFLFEEKNDPTKLSWLTWQTFGTLGTFLIYLRNVIRDKDLFATYKKDLMGAYQQCLVEDFTVLQQYLLTQDKLWIKDFVQEDFPKEGKVSEYIQIFQRTNFSSLFSEKLYENLSRCSIVWNRNQFFTYLRKILKAQNTLLKERFLSWESAIYFPVKNCYLVHALNDSGDAEKQRSWLSETVQTGGEVEVCAPLNDEKGIPQKPLLDSNITEIFLDEFNQVEYIYPKNFTLPKGRINFSCKAWERFYLCPRRAWLDGILKVIPMSLDNYCLKAKILGEWVHANLQFKQQPKTLKAWYEQIAKNAADRWYALAQTLNNKMPYMFRQWHLRALTLSYKLAHACEDLLNDWQLFSEYPLPKNSEYKGRIDLFAVRGNQAIIVDYKTAVHYSFTKQQISRGHGLQLLLYGRVFQKMYDEVVLRVVDKNGNNLILNLADLSDSVQNIETWMHTIKTTGVYENLPEEPLNTLPLCWPSNN